MSGRKACEVASILNETEAIQKDIFDSYKNDIAKDITSIKNMNDSISTNKQRIDEYELKDFQDIKEELPLEASSVESKLDELKKSISTVGIENVNLFENEEKEIESEIDDSNRKASILRTKIRNSPHYVDKEYNEAQGLKANLNSSKEAYRELKYKVNRAENKSSQTEIEVSSKIEDLNHLDNEVSRLDSEATTIKKIRNEADELMKSIQKSMDDIDKTKAEKFEQKRFETIEQELKRFKDLSNEEVIKAYAVFSASISTLKSNYNQKYNEWLAEKNYSEKLLKNVSEKGLKEELTFLDDIVNGNDIKVSKLAYYDEYKKSKKLDEFNLILQDAEKSLKQEKFEVCNEQLQKAKELYENVSNETDTIREHIEASANLAFKIRKIMLSDDINFRKAHLELIDGNPLNGFRLECQNGDTINFEEIKFDESGDLIINLDHIENTGGTCGVRWGKMQKVFNEQGIPLTDVKKNGNSVIYRDVRKKTSTEQTAQRG